VKVWSFLCAKFDVFAGTNWRAGIVSISEDQTDTSGWFGWDLNIPLFGDDIKGRYTTVGIIPFDGIINGRGVR
jgi:hypothetical protein